MTMNVAFITDDNYAMPTCVAMVSLVHHNKDHNIHFYIICDAVSETKKEKFLELRSDRVHIHLIEDLVTIPDDMTQGYAGEYVSKTAQYKFFLPEIIESKDKVRYLDGDVIVNGNLSTFYNIDISDVCVAAVEDMGDIRISEEGQSVYASQIGMRDHRYFNSGVMLLNLKLMREQSITEKLIAYRQNETNIFMDQDAFNAVLVHEKKLISYQYNFRAPIFDQIGFEKVNDVFFGGQFQSPEDCISHQVILHLTDRLKPWKYQIMYFTDIFLKYYKLSPYHDEKIKLNSAVYEVYQEKENIYVELQHIYEGLHQAYEDLQKTFQKVSVDVLTRQHFMDWHFPVEQIAENAAVIIYGAGEVGRSFANYIDKTHYCKLVLWVDQNYENLDERVVSPNAIEDISFDYIVVAQSVMEVSQEIEDRLIERGVSAEKIISFQFEDIRERGV